MRTTPFRQSQIRLAALICCTFSLTSCSNFPKVAVDQNKLHFHERGMVDTQGMNLDQSESAKEKDLQDRKRKLYEYLRDQFAREQGLYITTRDDHSVGNQRSPDESDELARPQTCLALSGGGMRSAAYSIGVLKALHLLKVLPHIDIISGDSGGSYAVGWYIDRMIGEDKDEDYDANMLFGTRIDDGNIASLDQNQRKEFPPSLGFDVSEQEGKLASTDWAVYQAILALAMSPYNIVANGLFKAGVPGSYLASSYEDRLFEVFLEKDKTKGSADEKNKTNQKSKTKRRLSDYGKLFMANQAVERKRLPFFILNAAAVNRFYDPKVGNASLFKHYFHEAFEMTPSHIGSDINGYVRFRDNDRLGDYDMQIVKAMAISGAAVDFNATFNSGIWSWLLGATNLNLGQKIKNYSGDAKESQAIQFVPVVNYVDSLAKFKERRGITDIHLTDGAVADNYATYAVVKRLCRKLIMVDAVWDPDFKFKEYKSLRDRLDRLGINLKVNEIEEYLDYLKPLNGEVPVEGVPGFSKVHPRATSLHHGISWYHPVMTGEITGITYRRGGGDLQKPTTDIVYIRLSMQSTKGKEGGYGSATRDYVKKTQDGFWQKIGGHFPHEWTLDQNFEALQFNAYRDLGCTVTVEAKETLKNILKLPKSNRIPIKDLVRLCHTPDKLK